MNQDCLITHCGKFSYIQLSFSPYAPRGAYARYAGYAIYAGYEDFPSPNAF